MPSNEASGDHIKSVCSPSVYIDEYSKKYPRLVSSLCSLGVGAVLHPLHCTKLLIQLGHEPLPLQRAKSYILFGRDVYFLPNILKYTAHIKKRNGITTLYTGVGTSLCYNLFALGVSIRVLDYLNENFPDEIVPVEQLKKETTGQAYSRFVKKLSKETASKAFGIILARPLQVVVIRRIAQIIGGESIYLSTFGSLKSISDEEGIRGLFAGLVPQLIGELMFLWASSTLLFAIDRYLDKCHPSDQSEESDKSEESDPISAAISPITLSWKRLAHFAIPFFVGGICYPFQLVSTVMAVNDTSLKIGQPPFMPVFLHWQDCWAFLAKENSLKRGSKQFLRTYVGPVEYKDGTVYARAPKYGTTNQNAFASFLNDLQKIGVGAIGTSALQSIGCALSSYFFNH